MKKYNKFVGKMPYFTSIYVAWSLVLTNKRFGDFVSKTFEIKETKCQQKEHMKKFEKMEVFYN